MDFTWDPAKDHTNRRKHGLGFDFAELVFRDPLLAVVFDRIENGEARFHAIGCVGSRCLLAVYTLPDPEDDDFVRIIGLRQATAAERRRYEEDRFA